MSKNYKHFILFLTVSFLLLPLAPSGFSFISAQQPQWYLHYSTGNLWDFFLDLYFIDQNYGWVAGTNFINEKLLLTTDGGSSWIEVPDPLPGDKIIAVVFFIDTLTGWVGGYDGDIFKTLDGGYSWTSMDIGPGLGPVKDIYFINYWEGFAVGGENARGFIKHTTDGGSTWQLVNNDTLVPKRSISFSDSLHGLIVGWHRQVYLTQDGGATWTLNTNFNPAYDFVACNSINDHTFVIAGCKSISPPQCIPLFGKSTDWGQTWEFTEWQTSEVEYFTCVDFIDEQRGWFGAEYGKFIYTDDGGQSFQVFNSGLDNTIWAIQMLTENNGWACGTGGGPIFKYGIPTGHISNRQDKLITTEFFLSQNYPNPFNSNTQITLHLFQKSYLQVTIYNANGQKVINLLNEFKLPGIYQLSWNGRDAYQKPLASGVYFVSCKTKYHQQTLKMLLIK